MNEDLTLEKLKIDERLRAVEGVLRELSTLMTERISETRKAHDNLDKLVRHHDNVIFGNGANPGIRVQIDRVEKGITQEFREHKRWDQWLFGFMISLLIPIFVMVARAVITGR